MNKDNFQFYYSCFLNKPSDFLLLDCHIPFLLFAKALQMLSNFCFLSLFFYFCQNIFYWILIWTVTKPKNNFNVTTQLGISSVFMIKFFFDARNPLSDVTSNLVFLRSKFSFPNIEFYLSFYLEKPNFN